MRTWCARAALLLTILISVTALTVGAYAWENEQHALNNVLDQDEGSTFVTVELPVIRKVVEGRNAPTEEFTFVLYGKSGAPMPEGTSGSRCRVSGGKGTIPLGSIIFDVPGTYVYTVYEENDGDINWTYDDVDYTLTITVERDGDELAATCRIEKNGKSASRIVFTNIYEKIDLNREITVSGQKTWNHGANPEKERPDHIIVLLYANGELIQQKKVTAKSGWKYSFTVPKYTSTGEVIEYEIDEEAVKDYRKTVKGYDLTNTYTGTPDTSNEPNKPTGSTTPSRPPKTGDEFNLTLWCVLMGVGLDGFLLMLLLLRKNPLYQGLRLKKEGKRLR